MLATAVYPAYHRGVPAAFSSRVVTGLLREDLNYAGLVVTDDLETPAVRAFTSPAEGAVRTIEAYRGLNARYTFPTLEELRALFADCGFGILDIAIPRYELGVRCPTFVLTPPRSE